MYNSAYFNDRYKVLKQIGKGGMSFVYLCVDKNIGKKWAIKCINYSNSKSDGRKHLKSSNGCLAESEINLLKSLDYYMFPQIIDAFRQNNNIYIVTDYVEGENLESYLKREGPMPVNTALKYFEELLNALIYLHSRNPAILYLDMKPANIMLKPDGSIKLIDFGIAGSILLKSKSLGSIGYSPPEQYVAGSELSERTDMFALAMTLYSMLTGEKPDKNLQRQRELVSQSKEIPHFLKEIILSCINEKVELRPYPEDVIKTLRENKARGVGSLPVCMVAGLVLMSITILSLFGVRALKQYKAVRYREEMLTKASEYIENGEYNLQGVKIICGYIDSRLLDDKTTDYFTYEVAKNYFDIQKDYGKARIYFKRLDLNIYPEAARYIRLCDGMRKFSDDENTLAGMLTNEIENTKNRNKEKE